MKIMPSEVDKQDLDILLWILLSEETQQEEYNEDAPIMGLF